MALFAPTVYKNRITDITAEELDAWGVRGLLLDVDNTLTAHDSQELSEAVRTWLSARRAEGRLLTVVSNNKAPRVAPFAARIGLPFTPSAAKPLPRGFWRAAKSLGLSKKECLVIGDQIFTDILGANLSGIRSVQLMPIEPERDQPFIQFKRRLERPLVAHYLRKRGITL
ncbi:MAG: YqeG family HAD IIIA-type phosphatase [Clostridia bacterium]|nr:YqeG family HAD IIIA-type phosphatase [Clostridia bacterium]